MIPDIIPEQARQAIQDAINTVTQLPSQAAEWGLNAADNAQQAIRDWLLPDQLAIIDLPVAAAQAGPIGTGIDVGIIIAVAVATLVGIVIGSVIAMVLVAALYEGTQRAARTLYRRITMSKQERWESQSDSHHYLNRDDEQDENWIVMNWRGDNK